MVAFWPWRGDSSTASFEKTLSNLATKISDTQASLDQARVRARRTRVFMTLYMTFAYLVYAIVLLLVVGYTNLGAYEWTGMAGGPVFIYVVRTMLSAFYNFRIETLSNRLQEYQKERAKTIKKLKEATKYDSTLELIEKYGGVDIKPKGNKKKDGTEVGPEGSKSNKNGGTSHPRPGTAPGRTTLPPPPTANIPRRMAHTPEPEAPKPMQPNAEFAPNADVPQRRLPLPSHPSYNSYHQHDPTESHWYDRIFDVLLGEDETNPKNRIVLLCANCRLVNGQAQPGCKTMVEVGPWRCMACGMMNNNEVQDEGKRIVNEVLSKAREAGKGEESMPELEEEGEDESEEKGSGSDKSSISGPAAAVRKRRAAVKENK